MGALLTRVTKANPCPVCKKPDWCMFNQEVVLCMRVQSTRPKQFKDGSLGWLHRNGAEFRTMSPKPERRPSINATAILREWARLPRNKLLVLHARQLGVTLASLKAIGAVPAPYFNTWGFPMKDGFGNNIGIRLRNVLGQKWAFKGSASGLFLPLAEMTKTVLVVEGPTNTAAGLSLGYFTIGLPQSGGGISHLIHAVRRLRVSQCVVVADNKIRDDGREDVSLIHSKRTVEMLPVPATVAFLPTKDVREFINMGGTQELLSSIIKGLTWNQPKHQPQSQPAQP